MTSKENYRLSAVANATGSDASHNYAAVRPSTARAGDPYPASTQLTIRGNSQAAVDLSGSVNSTGSNAPEGNPHGAQNGPSGSENYAGPSASGSVNSAALTDVSRSEMSAITDNHHGVGHTFNSTNIYTAIQVVVPFDAVMAPSPTIDRIRTLCDELTTERDLILLRQNVSPTDILSLQNGIVDEEDLERVHLCIEKVIQLKKDEPPPQRANGETDSIFRV